MPGLRVGDLAVLLKGDSQTYAHLEGSIVTIIGEEKLRQGYNPDTYEDRLNVAFAVRNIDDELLLVSRYRMRPLLPPGEEEQVDHDETAPLPLIILEDDQ
jgi:hypothetical protein